jgi:hypothetical protein
MGPGNYGGRAGNTVRVESVASRDCSPIGSGRYAAQAQTLARLTQRRAPDGLILRNSPAVGRQVAPIGRGVADSDFVTRPRRERKGSSPSVSFKLTGTQNPVSAHARDSPTANPAAHRRGHAEAVAGGWLRGIRHAAWLARDTTDAEKCRTGCHLSAGGTARASTWAISQITFLAVSPVDTQIRRADPPGSVLQRGPASGQVGVTGHPLAWGAPDRIVDPAETN